MKVPIRARRLRVRAALIVVVTAAALFSTATAATADGNHGRDGHHDRGHETSAIVFNGEGNNLNAYTPTPPFRKQTVIHTRADDPRGLDINGQICFFPDGSRRFVAGEDTGQPNPPQGWGIFQLHGDRVGSLSATEVAKLTPTYQPSVDNAENYGCGFLSHGRVLTTDVGNQATGTGDGQLIVWFPPFRFGANHYCKVATDIATAGGIHVDGHDRVYVASARAPTAGIWRYTDLPTSDTAAGGCGAKDATGAPLATSVHRSLFITADPHAATPNAIVASGHGTFYVSSVFTGTIAEYDRRGTFLRTILAPPAGDMLGAKPYSTGTPLGIGVGPDGSIYYADIGIVISSGGIGPGNDTGTVRRIRFVHGVPQAPQTMDTALAFPDGIGILTPRAHQDND
ncbi:MAG TPA: hypothetical protein VIB48_09415 [Acidimicrobiia bacterium]|jgi:hypothetical protein